MPPKSAASPPIPTSTTPSRPPSAPATPRTPSKSGSGITRSISACQRCRSRKTRCDQLFPSCTACTKAGVECVGVDAATGREIPRSYISHLEERIATLEAELEKAQSGGGVVNALPNQSHGRLPSMSEDNTAPGSGYVEETGKKRKASEPQFVDGEPSLVRSPVQVVRDEQKGAHVRPDIENLVTTVSAVTVQGTEDSNFLGSSSGISFAKLMFAAVKVSSKDNGNLPARTAAFRGKLPVGLVNKHHPDDPPGSSQGSDTPPVAAALQRVKPRPDPAPFPDRRTAEDLADIFFNQANPQIPILHRPGFTERFNSVYSILESSPGMKESQLPESEHPTLYFLNMVFAIASGMRSDTKSMPEEYHSAAAQYMDSLFSTTNRLDGLKGVLLLALYSLMRPAAPGVWYVLGSALRMCVDLGLHQETANMSQHVDALTLDERRRLFWAAYSLDRQVCVYLGRPFGISDDAIKVPFPEDIDDEFISMHGIMTDHPMAHQKSSRTIARHMFRIRQLQSEIQRILYQQSEIPRRFATLTDWRKDMEARVNDWTMSVPKSEGETNCGYNMGFIDLNYQQTRLLLYGLSPAIPEPDAEAYLVIADSGNRIIKAYKELHEQKKINYTWVACHNLFMASTSYLCALWHCAEVRKRITMDEIDFNTRACVKVLDSMQDQCPAAQGCRDVFLNLATATVQLCNDFHKQKGDRGPQGKRIKGDNGWSRQRGGSRSKQDNKSVYSRTQLEPIQHTLPASLANIVHSTPSPVLVTRSPTTQTQTVQMQPLPEMHSHHHSPPLRSPAAHHQQMHVQTHAPESPHQPMGSPHSNYSLQHGGGNNMMGPPSAQSHYSPHQMYQDPVHQQQQQQHHSQDPYSMSPPSQSPVSHSSHLSQHSGVQSPISMQHGQMILQDFNNHENFDQVMRTAEELGGDWDVVNGNGGQHEGGEYPPDGMGSRVFQLISGVGGGEIWSQYDFNGDSSDGNNEGGGGGGGAGLGVHANHNHPHGNEYAMDDAANIGMGMGNIGFISSHLGGQLEGHYGNGYVHAFPGGF